MATSIESKLSLALAVKLKAIFEQPEKTDKFLTFPKGIGFTYDYLKFMGPPGESGLSAVAQQNLKCDFARTMNVLFSDSPQYVPDASEFLWEKFEKILKKSTYPQTTLTELEEKQLSEATQFLTIEKTDENGSKVLVPSPAYNTYIQYKTIYDKATNVYIDEKLSAENASGPGGEAHKKNWQDFREKQLIDQITKAENDWLNLGYKLQIESYQAIKNALEQKKFVDLVTQAYLNDLKQSDVPDLNANGLSVKLTLFSPFDIADKTVPWISLNLTKNEINNFVQQAPPELKAIFDSGEGNDDIESVSLEYNTIAIIRPWWKQEYFMSRYWRLSDGSLVSNGNIPCQGEIPAYISSMVVARNITITRRKSSSDKPTTPPIIPILSTFSVKSTEPVALHFQMSNQKMIMRELRTESMSIENDAPLASVPLHSVVASKSPELRFRKEPTEPIVSDGEPTVKRLEPRHTYSNLMYLSTTIATPIFVPPKDSGTPERGTDLVTETYPFDGVFVLAYMCKRIRKSPNPDPTLKWS